VLEAVISISTTVETARDADVGAHNVSL